MNVVVDESPAVGVMRHDLARGELVGQLFCNEVRFCGEETRWQRIWKNKFRKE